MKRHSTADPSDCPVDNRLRFVVSGLSARRRGVRSDGAARRLPETPPLSQVPALHLSLDRRVLGQPQVRSRSMVVAEIARQDPSQMFPVEHNDMVQTLPSDQSDQTLGESILPRTSRTVSTATRMRERRTRLSRPREPQAPQSKRLRSFGEAQLPQPLPDRPSRAVSAARTAESFRPAQLEQIIPTSLLRRKAGLELSQVPRIVLHRTAYYILGLPESSKYPIWPYSCPPWFAYAIGGDP